MAFEVFVPRLGWSMDEGVFIAWLKQDGERVEEGDVLFTLECDKAVEEVEAIDSGILRIPPHGPSEGDTLAVGTVLAYLVQPNETPPFEAEDVKSAPLTEPSDAGRVAPIDHSGAGPTDHLSRSERPTMTTTATTTVPNRRPSRKDGLPRISPRAARLAAELGVEWTRLKGSGHNGRIRQRDVRAVASTPPLASVAGSTEVEPVSNVRRIIADRMMTSRQNTAPVTLTTTADATNLVALRGQFRSAANTAGGLIPSFTDFIVKLTAGALDEHPRLNSRWNADRIALSCEIHIGVAVETDAGLVAPIIRDVGSLSLRQVAERARELIDHARRRRLAADQLQGGTFTITNLGTYGIEAFTPIINYPECAILGIGRIAKQPAVVDERIVPRDMMTLSLTFDHRIVDGAPAAEFLKAVRERIETPGPWLMP